MGQGETVKDAMTSEINRLTEIELTLHEALNELAAQVEDLQTPQEAVLYDLNKRLVLARACRGSMAADGHDTSEHDYKIGQIQTAIMIVKEL